MAQQLEHLKWVNGTRFMVDGFNFTSEKCSHYFLTHAHSDHTTGLRRDFTAGTIYCSPITASLLVHDLRIPAQHVHALPVNEPLVMEGVTITLMDANHCPGAVMLLFQVPACNGERAQNILHTGDMRWQPRLAEHPALKACQVDLIYMDTTYCLPKHAFPSQDMAIATMVKLAREAHTAEPKTLFVVGSYHIGKERAFFALAHALEWRIWCEPAKKKVLVWCETCAEDMALLTDDPNQAQIHVVFMGAGLQPEALQTRMEKGDWAQVVAFRPTGWSFQKRGVQTRREGCCCIYGIPYSEHSSWPELRNCVQLLRPRRIIPTVNTPDAAAARRIVDRFADLMDLSGDRSRLDMYLKPAARARSAPAIIDSPAASQRAEAPEATRGASPAAEAAHAAGSDLHPAQTAPAAVPKAEDGGADAHSPAAEQQGDEAVDLDAVDVAEQALILQQLASRQAVELEVARQRACRKRQGTLGSWWSAGACKSRRLQA